MFAKVGCVFPMVIDDDSSSLYHPTWHLDQITIEKMHPTVESMSGHDTWTKKCLNPTKVFLILLSRLTYFDYIELMPRFSCSIPTVTWFRHAEHRIPENFKENRKWDVKIVRAPECPPTVEILRLIKTAPFNFELRKVSKVYDHNESV